MLSNLLKGVDTIYIAYGSTDFRRQISSLCKMVQEEYRMNPYDKVAYIFCNRKRNSIKVLTYDKNGFILAQKTLLDVNGMKFRWPRNKGELKSITKEQLEWLLSGLEIYPKKFFQEINLEENKIAI